MAAGGSAPFLTGGVETFMCLVSLTSLLQRHGYRFNPFAVTAEMAAGFSLAGSALAVTGFNLLLQWEGD